MRKRETEHKMGRAESEEDRSRLQTLRCQHRIWHGIQTHEPWAPELSWRQKLNQLSYPGVPLFFFFLSFILFILKERQREWRRGRERERDRQIDRQTESQAGSMLQQGAWYGARTHETGRSWPELKAEVRCLTDWATQAPPPPPSPPHLFLLGHLSDTTNSVQSGVRDGSPRFQSAQS